MRAPTGGLRLAAVAASVGLLAACGGSDGDGSTGDSSATAEGDGGQITVAAAASLTDTFTELAESFEEETGTQVDVTFAGSSDLVAQIEGGAPFDVFASADEANMAKVEDDVEGTPALFASNTLTIVTEPGNPLDISGLEDLTSDDVTVVVCAPQVPCGAATETVEEAAGITLTPASEESKVTDVLAKVRAGEADAGLVYVTDAAGAGDDVTTVEFPEAGEAVNLYPIATLADSDSPDQAAAFRDYVSGPKGQSVLSAAGFGPPE